MTEKEAIEAIKLEGLSITGNAGRIGQFFEGLRVATGALATMQMITESRQNYMQEKPISTDKVANSIRDIDLSDLRLPEIVVFDKPEDYPDKVVARIFDMNNPTDTVIVKHTLEELQRDIRENTDMVFMPRDEKDVKSLAGVWI